MDKIYVIYYIDEMHIKDGLRTCYLNQGSAKRVVSSEARKLAENEIYYRSNKNWKELIKEEKKVFIDKYKKRFELRIFTETIDSINQRELIYKFFDLSFIQQTKILIDLNLLENNDKQKRYGDIIEKILNRAKKQNKLYDLWSKVSNP